jgi:hypothetical protein
MFAGNEPIYSCCPYPNASVLEFHYLDPIAERLSWQAASRKQAVLRSDLRSLESRYNEPT